MREYLDPVVKADQYAQNVDDIGIARLVGSCSLYRETYQARRQQSKNSRLKTSYVYVTFF